MFTRRRKFDLPRISPLLEKLLLFLFFFFYSPTLCFTFQDNNRHSFTFTRLPLVYQSRTSSKTL